jgi:hypothetical protein
LRLPFLRRSVAQDRGHTEPTAASRVPWENVEADMVKASLEALEGRLVAQRELLGRLVAEVVRRGRGDALLDFLRERRILRDGQEDPGAVPTAALDFELAMADEYALLAEAARRAAAEAPSGAQR